MRLKHHLGQNLLINNELARQIVEAAGITKTDTVLEIGTGTGALTQHLAECAHTVFSVEKDPEMASLAEAACRHYNNIVFINDDFLHVDVPKVIPGAYTVVANIPYYITQKIIMLLLESSHPPKKALLMIQKEVALRLIGDRKYRSALTIFTAYLAHTRQIFAVGKENFNPEPEVDSAVVEFIPTTPAERVFSPDEQRKFFSFIKAGFSHRRKKLKNNIRSLAPDIAAHLTALHLAVDCRPADLALDDWIRLYQHIHLSTS